MTRSQLLIISMTCLFLLVLGDCWSTYLGLITPNVGYHVWEYNQLSGWMFQTFGLIQGLVIFALVKGLGLVYLYTLSKKSAFNNKVISVMVVGAILITGYVNLSNWHIYMMLKGTV